MYRTNLGFDDSFDYEKELKRTDISDGYRKILEKEKSAKETYDSQKIKEPAINKESQKLSLNNDYTLFDNTGNQISKPLESASAMAKTQEILDKINSGKTSFSESLKGLIGEIQGRKSFAYDFNSDPLFQQALNSSMMSGQVAMQDTIGQASALTGGYGSTYATTAANNVYNQYVQGAYDKLPEFYNMALNQHQMEGDELYRQYAMLSEQDSTEFARLMDAYNTNYGRYRDTVADQRYEDELSYNRAWDEKSWEHQLEREGVEDERYATESEKEDEYREWQKGMSEAELQYQKEQDYIKNQQYINENDWNGDRKVDVNDSKAAAEWEAQYMSNAVTTKSDGTKQFTYTNGNGEVVTGNVNPDDLAEYISVIKTMANNGEIDNYIAKLGEVINEDEQAYLSLVYSKPERATPANRTWTMTYDGGDNGGGGIDEDALFEDDYGQEVSAITLYHMVYNELIADGKNFTTADKEATNFVLNLQKSTGATRK